MESYALIFDHLDRAADEILAKNAICDRLALILIDNAVELIVHERCQTLIMFDRPSWMGPPKYSSRQRSNALSQDLDKKISFLENAGEIRNELAIFAKSAHELRNVSFHAGIKNEEILHAVACTFFDVACEIFEKLGTGLGFIQLTSDRHKLGERFFNYLAINDLHEPVFHGPDRKKISAHLKSKVGMEIFDLQDTLSRQLNKEISRIESDLDFIEKNSPNKPSREEAIEDSQFYYEIDRRSNALPLPHTPEYEDAYKKMISEARKNWRPKFINIPFSSWKKKAELLKSGKDPLLSIEKFLNFRREMRDIADAVSEMSFELDGWIQNQIDIARGK